MTQQVQNRATVPAPVSQQQQVPKGPSLRRVRWMALVGIALIGIVALFIFLAAATDLFPRKSAPTVQPDRQTQSGPAPAESNSAPAQTEPEMVTPIVLTIELKREKIGETSNGEQVMTLPIPWDKIQAVFIPVRPRSDGQGYDRTKNDLGLDGSCSAQGDGIAFVAACVGDDYARFTPNRGVNWYRVQDTPGLAGATLEGDHITLFTYAQTEPWVDTYWRIEIPLSAIEGLSR